MTSEKETIEGRQNSRNVNCMNRKLYGAIVFFHKGKNETFAYALKKKKINTRANSEFPPDGHTDGRTDVRTGRHFKMVSTPHAKFSMEISVRNFGVSPDGYTISNRKKTNELNLNENEYDNLGGKISLRKDFFKQLQPPTKKKEHHCTISNSLMFLAVT